ASPSAAFPWFPDRGRLKRTSVDSSNVEVARPRGRAIKLTKGGPLMDRRQMVAQRAREFFGERLDDVVHMVRQDRQGLRGWEEPAHVRAVVRRAIREAA